MFMPNAPAGQNGISRAVVIFSYKPHDYLKESDRAANSPTLFPLVPY